MPPAVPRPSERRIPPWAPWVVAGSLAVAASALILFANRGTTFLLDDWAYLIYRAPNLSAASLFNTQNGNWTTTTVLTYRGLADVFGVGSYLPWRLTLLAAHLAGCAIVYVLARRRIGPWWALVPLALVLVSRGWETLLWPFQIGQALSILSGLGALLLLDRRDLRGDLGASGLLVISLASSSYGPPFALVVAVELLLSRWRALWVLVAPAAAWVWWQEEYNSAIPAQGATNLDGYRYAVRLGWEVMPGGPSGLLGTSFGVGRALLVLVVVLAALRIVWERRVPARLIALLAGYFAYWWGVAWARSEVPDLGRSPRYLHLAVVLFVLAAVELFAGLDVQRIGARLNLGRARRAMAALLLAIVLLVAGRAVVLTADVMKKGSDATLRKWGQRMLAQEAAYGVGRPALRADSPFYIETSGAFALQLPLDRVELTVRHFGGSRYTGEEALLKHSPDARAYADQALGKAQGAIVPAPPEAAPIPVGAGPLQLVRAAVPTTTARGCLRWSSGSGPVRVGVPAGGLQVSNTARAGDLRVALVRWTDRAGASHAIATPGTFVTVRPRADHSRRPWRLEALGPAGSICALPDGR